MIDTSPFTEVYSMAQKKRSQEEVFVSNLYSAIIYRALKDIYPVANGRVVTAHEKKSALKFLFSNECRFMCDAIGFDYSKIKENAEAYKSMQKRSYERLRKGDAHALIDDIIQELKYCPCLEVAYDIITDDGAKSKTTFSYINKILQKYGSTPADPYRQKKNRIWKTINGDYYFIWEKDENKFMPLINYCRSMNI